MACCARAIWWPTRTNGSIPSRPTTWLRRLELPPNGQGISVLQILNILEPYDIKSMTWGSAAATHLFIEAKKLAYADRARFYADMAMADVPLQQLISKEYAAQRAKLIQPSKALVNVPAGDPKLKHSDTIYLCVVDKDRNCCSLIQSNFHGFGSQLVAGEAGFACRIEAHCSHSIQRIPTA